MNNAKFAFSHVWIAADLVSELDGRRQVIIECAEPVNVIQREDGLYAQAWDGVIVGPVEAGMLARPAFA